MRSSRSEYPGRFSDVQYLSDEWIGAADQAVRSHPDLVNADLPAPTILGFRVTGGPAGQRRWRVVLDGPRTRIDTEPGPADVEFIQSWDTAVAVARGLRNAPAAFLAGDVRVEGDRHLLVRHTGPLSTIGDVLAPLADRTDW